MADLQRQQRRMALVEEHVRRENEHDLDGVLGTFGEHPRYEDESWGEDYLGMDGVHEYYSDVMRGLPDLSIEVVRRHMTEEVVILEVVIRGTHEGTWRGLPPTGRRVEFPLCAVYTFDADDRLAGERIYYDRATVLRQLGVFHEPQALLGRVETVVAHPATMARSAAHLLLRRVRA